MAFQLSALYSTLGVSLSRLVGDYLRAKAGGYGEMMEFVTQVLGLPYDGAVTNVGSKLLRSIAKKDASKVRGTVPAWTRLLVAGVDTQKNGFYWVVRSFDRTQSQLVDFGYTGDIADLERMLVRPWAIEGTSEPGRLSLMLIDAGGSVKLADRVEETTTDLVYRFSLYDPRVLPCLGRDAMEPPYVRLKQSHKFGDFTGRLVQFRPDHFKDCLSAEWIKKGDERTWRMCDGAFADKEYLDHLGNGRKIETKDGQLRWGRRYHNAKIDYLDAETLTMVGLRLAQLGRAAGG